jgi:hypothetical protein
MKAFISRLPLEHRRDALAAADAHRHQRVAAAGALQLVQRLGGDEGARAADRVAERDGAAVRVGLGRVELQAARDRDGLGREGFVALDHVHLVDRQAGLLQRQLGRRDRAFAHDLVGHAGHGVADQARHRLVAGLGRHGGVGQHEEGGAVVDARGIAGGDRLPSFLNAGFSLARLSIVVPGLTCSSVSKTTSPLRVFSTMGRSGS